MVSIRFLVVALVVVSFLAGVVSASQPGYTFGTLGPGGHGCANNQYQQSGGCAENDGVVNPRTNAPTSLCCDLGTGNCAYGTPLLSSQAILQGSCVPPEHFGTLQLGEGNCVGNNQQAVGGGCVEQDYQSRFLCCNPSTNKCVTGKQVRSANPLEDGLCFRFA